MPDQESGWISMKKDLNSGANDPRTIQPCPLIPARRYPQIHGGKPETMIWPDTSSRQPIWFSASLQVRRPLHHPLLPRGRL
jgi:hypothetical protein